MALRSIIREGLRQLDTLVKQGETFRNGICGQLAGLCSEIADERGEEFDEYFMHVCLYNTWANWPHYSGNKDYPVPDPDYPGSPFAAYEAYDAENMWTGRYGELRRDLLTFLLKEIA